MNNVIAIDGPAGSGKGTVAKKVAEKLGYVYIDTGAMYRCVTLATIKKGYTLEEEDKIVELSNNIDIKLTSDNKVYLDNEDVTKLIREPEVNNLVSPLSLIKDVKTNLINLQRKMIEKDNLVMEGRDITTIVFPESKYKFYLDATAEERATRRYKESQEKGIDITYEEVLANVNDRDYRDSHREYGALTRTDEQVYIDSTNMTIDEVVDKIISYIK